MSYCKHCGERLSALELTTKHHCRAMGILDALTDGSFIVSTIVGASTGSSFLGSVGGNLFGGTVDNVIGGITSIFGDDDDDDDDDDWDD